MFTHLHIYLYIYESICVLVSLLYATSDGAVLVGGGTDLTAVAEAVAVDPLVAVAVAVSFLPGAAAAGVGLPGGARERGAGARKK